MAGAPDNMDINGNTMAGTPENTDTNIIKLTEFSRPNHRVVPLKPKKKKKKRKSSESRERGKGADGINSEQKEEPEKEVPDTSHSPDVYTAVDKMDTKCQPVKESRVQSIVVLPAKQTNHAPILAEVDNSEQRSNNDVKQDTHIFYDALAKSDEVRINKIESAPQMHRLSQNSSMDKTESLEIILQPNGLDKDAQAKDPGEKLAPPSPAKSSAKKKHSKLTAPHRSISLPVNTRHRKRSDSTNSSKWTAIKHAVRITNNMTKQRKSKQDSFMEKFNTNRRVNEPSLCETDASGDSKTNRKSYLEVKGRESSQQCCRRYCNMIVFHPDGTFMFYWLMLLSLTVEYNLWILILRQAFSLVQEELSALWYVLDAVADVTYILDILVHLRTGYLEDGLLVTKHSKLVKHYVRSRYFAMDVASIIPLDFLQFNLGIQPLLRFPRFIKVYRLIQFFYLAENQATYPNVLRVCNLTHILLLLCHWFAAFYYMISKSEGLSGTWTIDSTNETTFSQTTRVYLKSLYWSTLTLTTIGDLPSPESNWQYLFQILSYLIGVFVFATIVGQVGNSINNYNATRHEYEQLLDGAKLYMRKHEVPKDMQVRVQRWCDYAWTRGRMQGALDINSLKMLPDRLKTELALHVHLDILKQVSIFEDCEPEFLHDLVLKMQTYIFTPGDMVVRKGEIAREMFIIADGHLDVIGEKGKIIARLSTGNFFGEIGILNLDGGINRRTADVKSVGYSELFVLKREDIVRAIKYYPSAKASLMKHAKMRLAEMREQSFEAPESIPETASSEPTPRIQTTLISEDESITESPRANLLDVPRRSTPAPRSRSRHGSIYSMKSVDLDHDTMDSYSDSEIERIKENELIAKLTEDLEKKDKHILQLTKELERVS